MTRSSLLDHTGAVILAAGKGTRMYSDTPKVLHTLLGEPMLRYVLAAAKSVCGDTTWVVAGHKAEMLAAAFPDEESRFIIQREQLGTGHALQVAWPAVLRSGITHLLVINGDTPLLPEHLLRDFAEACVAQDAAVAFMTLLLETPGAFGRVVRDAQGGVRAIVEAKDYDPAIYGPDPCEINAGIYCVRVSAVDVLLPLLRNNNKSGEFYITDLVQLAVAEGLPVLGIQQGDAPELLGINTVYELSLSEERLREKIVRQWQEYGVLIRAPHMVRIGPDVVLEKGVVVTGPFEAYGASRIDAGAQISSHCVCVNSCIGPHTRVESFCHLDGASIDGHCVVGPYARLRPGARMLSGSRVGNFVEMKQACLGEGAKANHLSYIGDAVVGKGANIGAGTITCNYDGKRKSKTVIGDGAFIGSNSALVAPVTIGDHALVGAGSVITRDVSPGVVAVTRAAQKEIRKIHEK